ncbi:MAG: hypothetical protein ACYSW6_11435 [Planctomycetota bacterium]|jgi:hypothetical protein
MKRLIFAVVIILILSGFLYARSIDLSLSLRPGARQGVVVVSGDTRVTVGADIRVTIGADTRTIP